MKCMVRALLEPNSCTAVNDVDRYINLFICNTNHNCESPKTPGGMTDKGSLILKLVSNITLK